MEIKIPIVLSANNKYAMPLGVCMTSILENKNKDTFYDFYILISSDFSDENKEKIDSLKKNYENFNINFITIENRIPDMEYEITYFSKETYYRLLIPEILPQEYKKAIYLDTDTIINTDLSELFNTNLGENYVAGVLNPYFYFADIKSEKRLQKTQEKGGIKDFSQYVNAGVLIFNLEAIRSNNVQKTFMELVPRNFPIVDQDIINTVCYNKILHIPFTYNLIPKFREFLKTEKISEIYDKRDLAKAFKTPSIIHWANREKPWQYKFIDYSTYWHKYFSLSPYKKEKLKLKNYYFTVWRYKIENSTFITVLKRKIKNFASKNLGIKI